MTLRTRLFLVFFSFAMIPLAILAAFAFLDVHASRIVSTTLEEDSKMRQSLLALAAPSTFAQDPFVEGGSGDIFVSTTQLLQRLLILSFFLVIAVFFLSFYLARTITRPIHSLSRVVDQMRRGNYAARAEIRNADEIGTFALTFNKMAEKIQRSHAHLEETVATRTKELRKAKVLDEQILASIGEGIVFVDPKGIVLMMNVAAETMLDRLAQDVLGKRWQAIAGQTDEKDQPVAKGRLLYEQAIASGSVVSSSVPGNPVYFTRKDGNRFPAAVTAAPVQLEEGLIGAIVVFRDMTDEKRIDDSKSEFVSLASHQLRTPLTAMRLFTELLISGKKGKLSAEQKEYLYYLQHAVVRMARLVNDLLNVSRIETGRLRIDPKPANLSTFMRKVVHDVEIIAEKKGVRFTVVSSPKRGISLPIDQDLLYQVVHNLLTNSIRYSAKMEPRVTISVRKSEGGGVIIGVEDNGIGIREEDKPHVFTKFFRADDARKKEPEGSGLGLYLTKTIIEQSGGRLWFESEQGKGTAFFVELPPDGMKSRAGEKSLSMDIA